MRGGELMRAMVLDEPGKPLRLKEIPKPLPDPDQVLIKVGACGVCRTDLHVVDGELPEPLLPLIPGHEIVGTIVGAGAHVREFGVGDRIGYTCGQCEYCRQGQENLCDQPKFMGYTMNGGYAEYVVADHRYCFRVPESYSDTAAAPLLCAGLIGYRSYRMIGEKARRIGIYGFGAAAHIIAQIAVYEHKRVYAFTRSGDKEAQQFALKLGATWAGESSELPPDPLDAAILFAPVGALLPAALKATAKGGIVVCGGIHMSDIPSFPYRLLWEERTVRSVANLTRADGEELLALAPKVPVHTQVELFRLDQANEALERLRKGNLQGVAVLTPL
jgi:propanol-preferring alcohol dehydrogenase